MGRYLVTGIAGSGKSTVAEQLKALGYAAFDIDADTQIAYSRNKQTGLKDIVPYPRPEGWRQNHSWVWDGEALQAFLAKHTDGNIFLCGYADNQAEYYHLFDRLFVLTLDTATLTNRLATRTNNSYGKQPAECDEAIISNGQLGQSMAAAGAVVIDAAQPLTRVLEGILSQINTPITKRVKL